MTKKRSIAGGAAGLILLACILSSEASARIVTDEIGRQVNITSRPQRIVSLAPNITEILFALGLDREIAGVTSHCNYPDKAKRKPRVGGFTNISLERIAMLRPDLIIGTADGNKKETVDQLEKIGFPVYVTNPRNMEGIFRTIGHIGVITGRDHPSRQLVSQLQHRVGEVVARTTRLPKPRVFFQVGNDPIVTVGRDTFLNELIALAGGINIAGHEAIKYPRYSIEGVIAGAPDVIVVSPMEGKRDFKRIRDGWQRWNYIPAVANGRIYLIDPDLVNRSSPRIVEGLVELAAIFHPAVSEESPIMRHPSAAAHKEPAVFRARR